MFSLDLPRQASSCTYRDGRKYRRKRIARRVDYSQDTRRIDARRARRQAYESSRFHHLQRRIMMRDALRPSTVRVGTRGSVSSHRVFSVMPECARPARSGLVCGARSSRSREPRVMWGLRPSRARARHVRECDRHVRELIRQVRVRSSAAPAGVVTPGGSSLECRGTGRGQARQLPLARRALHDSCSANRAIARPTRSALSCSEKHMGSCVSRALARVEELHSLVAQLRSLFAQFVQRRGSRAAWM